MKVRKLVSIGYDQAAHCRGLADALGKTVQEAQSLATEHERIAQSLQKKAASE